MYGHLGEGVETIDCDVMMSHCYDSEVTAEDTAGALCAAHVMEHGYISEDYLDELGFYATPGSNLRDDLIECRRHAFIAIHSETVKAPRV